MGVAEPLSNASLFWWGCLGGFAAAALTLTLPWLYGLWVGDEESPGLRRSLGGILLLVLHSVLGGIAALMVGGGSTDVGQAITFGLLWPTVFKSAGQTGEQILAAQRKAKKKDKARAKVKKP